MRRALSVGLLASALCSSQTFAPTGTKRFEVSTIRRSAPGTQEGPVRPAPGGRRYIGTGVPLRVYVWTAYQIRPEQIVGPAWIDSELYDMNAEAEQPSSIEDLHIMLQNALTERFHLKFHRTSREMAAYVLTVDKDGPKNLKSHTGVVGSDFNLDQKEQTFLHERWSAHCASLDFFTWRLSPYLERPILNQTGLKGCFDFDLAFTRYPPRGVQDGQLVNGAAVDTSGPTIFQALHTQLGLKIEAKKAPVDTLVIDSAERGDDE